MPQWRLPRVEMKKRAEAKQSRSESMTNVEHKTVARDEEGMRLDRWFKTHYAPLPLSRLV